MQKADILSVTLEEGELRVALGDSATNVAEIPDATFWALDGFFSRPKPPDENGACQALYERSGNAWRIVGTKDNRLVEKYGELADGDRAIVGYSSARIIIKDASDSITLLTQNHATGNGDATMLAQLSGKNGEWVIMVGGADGTALFKMKSGMIHMAVEGASFTLDKDGPHFTGKNADIATGGGNLGTIAGVPPAPGVNAVTMGAVGQTAVGSTKWVVAP